MVKRNCTPRSAAVPSQKTLFDPWPKDSLEPYGNPAYEGVGYPSAGYGQSRRKVVPLALPKVAAPQLTSNGWEGKVPQGTIITIGTLNPNSDAFTREQLAPLAGLGCSCSKTDARMAGALRGLAAATLGPVQELANSIANNVVPGTTLQAFVDKILADERANAETYRYIEALAKLQPGNKELPSLRAQQQKSWGETNTAKFYAFLVPVIRERLVGKVTKPDYRYIKFGGDGGVFTKVAQLLQDKAVGDIAQQLLKDGLIVDSTPGLAGLGIGPAGLGIIAASLIAAGITAYMLSTAADVIKTKSRDAITAQCVSGAIPKDACVAALNAGANPSTSWDSVAKYAAVGIGGLVLLQVIASIRSAIPAR